MHASHGHRADRPCLELSGVCLAASAYRSCPDQAEGRTDCTAAEPRSPGSPSWQETSTYACRDASRERKRGSPSAESCARDPLLFSRTTWSLGSKSFRLQLSRSCSRSPATTVVVTKREEVDRKSTR